MDRLVRGHFGPSWPKLFLIFLGPGPVRSEILIISCSGPKFEHFLVQNFASFSLDNLAGPLITANDRKFMHLSFKT